MSDKIDRVWTAEEIQNILWPAPSAVTEELARRLLAAVTSDKPSPYVKVLEEDLDRSTQEDRSYRWALARYLARCTRVLQVFETINGTECACVPSAGYSVGCERCNWGKHGGIQDQLLDAMDDHEDDR